MSLPIAVNPIAWSNDDMRSLGAHISLETCLSEAREAGYQGIELGHKFPRDAATLQPLLEGFGLRLASGWYSACLLKRDADAEIEAMQPHLTLLRQMGCQVMVFAEVTGCVHAQQRVPLSRRPRMSEEQWPLFSQRLQRVADYLREQGVALAYHHHMGTVIETADDVERLMDSTDSAVGLLLDTGHLYFAGNDPVATASAYASRVVHVHCKDVRAPVIEQARRDDLSFLDAVLAGAFTVPGDGALDFRPLMRRMKDQEYQGWLVVEAEQDPDKANPLHYARIGYDYLHDLTEAAGF